MKYIYFYASEIGNIGIAENDSGICNLYFPNEQIPAGFIQKETDLLQRAGEQLHHYLMGKCKTFNLPLAPEGTAFRLRVWDSLQRIPYGETRTYGEIAQSIGQKNASRAVGQANHHNPIPIIIPCHRVIGGNGKLVGYGSGLHIKSYLLELEKQHAHL